MTEADARRVVDIDDSCRMTRPPLWFRRGGRGKISASAQRVAWVLWDRSSFPSRRACPSAETICEDARISSRKTVSKALRELEDLGLIEKTGQFVGRGVPVYIVHDDAPEPDWDAESPQGEYLVPEMGKSEPGYLVPEGGYLTPEGEYLVPEPGYFVPTDGRHLPTKKEEEGKEEMKEEGREESRGRGSAPREAARLASLSVTLLVQAYREHRRPEPRVSGPSYQLGAEQLLLTWVQSGLAEDYASAVDEIVSLIRWDYERFADDKLKQGEKLKFLDPRRALRIESLRRLRDWRAGELGRQAFDAQIEQDQRDRAGQKPPGAFVQNLGLSPRKVNSGPRMDSRDYLARDEKLTELAHQVRSKGDVRAWETFAEMAHETDWSAHNLVGYRTREMVEARAQELEALSVEADQMASAFLGKVASDA